MKSDIPILSIFDAENVFLFDYKPSIRYKD